MADISLEDLQEFFNKSGESLGISTERATAFIDKLREGGSTMTTFSNLAAEFGNRVANSAQRALDAAGSFDVLKNRGTEMYDKLISGAVDFAEAQAEAAGGADVLAGKIALIAAVATSALPETSKMFDGVTESSEKFGLNVRGSVDSLRGVLGGAADGLMKVADAAERGFVLEKNVRDMAMAQGQLSTMVDETTGTFKDMNEEVDDYINMTLQSARATGMSMNSIMQLGGALRTIPDALSEPVQVGNTWQNQLVVTSRIASAFGRDQKEVAGDLTKLYDKLGQSGTGAFESISNILEQAGDSKLRMEGFRENVLSVADSFKMISSNVDGATALVKSFDIAFKDSAISPEAMTQVINSAAKGINQMSEGTAAFISAQTGGPGGLAGYFEMEQLKAEGRMDEVLRRTTEAMQAQFGGEILTREDAAQDPSKAGALYAQMQYLRQVAGVADSNEEAMRYLEAMKGGLTDALAAGIGRPEEQGKGLETAVDRGLMEQERTRSPLAPLQQTLEKSSLMQGKIFSSMMQQVNLTDSSVGILQEIAENTATTGVINAAEKNETFVSVSTEDQIRTDIEIFQEMFGKLTSVLAEKMGGGEEGGSGLFPGTTTEPTPTATAAGVGALNEVAGAQFGEDLGDIRPIPVELSSTPLDITINIPELDTKIDQRVDNYWKSKVNQGGLGFAPE